MLDRIPLLFFFLVSDAPFIKLVIINDCVLPPCFNRLPLGKRAVLLVSDILFNFLLFSLCSVLICTTICLDGQLDVLAWSNTVI